MQIRNVQVLAGIPFEDYLKMPGLSFSGVRSDGTIIEETEKMRFGSNVDAYLFEPQVYSGAQYKLVKPVAAVVKEKLGTMLVTGARQVVITCKMTHRGVELDYKGRADLLTGGGVLVNNGIITINKSLGVIVIDMKVSELPLLSAINFFGYNHQVNGYALPVGADVSVIVSVNPKTYKVSTQAIPTKADFWEKIVLQYGSVASNTKRV